MLQEEDDNAMERACKQRGILRVNGNKNDILEIERFLESIIKEIKKM